jgi:hypothetical protein
MPYVVAVQILRGDGSDSYYRSKVFLGTDGAPITFTVSPSVSSCSPRGHSMKPPRRERARIL